jgi:integrase
VRTYRRHRRGPRGAKVPYPKWWIELRDHNGIPRRFAGFTDRTASEELGRKVERLAEVRGSSLEPKGDLARFVEDMPGELRKRLARWGVLRAVRVAAARPLRELIDEWGETMGARDTTAEHDERSLRRVRALFGACGFSNWSDIRPEPVERQLRALREKDPAAIKRHLGAMGEIPSFTRTREAERLKTKGLGAKASNHYLATARAFARWAVEREYASEDPLRVLRPLNSRVDRRHIRRALSEADLGKLIRTTHAGPERGKVSGPVRATVYALAAETGLRAGEIASLRVAHFDLGDKAPSLTLPAHASKHRREDLIPLRPSTARALRGLLAGRGALESAFGLPAAWKPTRALEEDLAACKIDYRDESDRVFDFHALRGMQGTRLLAYGANPKAAQTLMRHSTADLTMSVYARIRPGEDRAALDLLPDLLPTDDAAARATGTDGRNASDDDGARGASDGASVAGSGGNSGALTGLATSARAPRNASGAIQGDLRGGSTPLSSTTPARCRRRSSKRLP